MTLTNDSTFIHPGYLGYAQLLEDAAKYGVDAEVVLASNDAFIAERHKLIASIEAAKALSRNGEPS